MSDTILLIQNKILKWFSQCAGPSETREVERVCHACAYSVLADEEKCGYSMYRFFYPLVRAGYLECGMTNEKIVWSLSSPAVFHSKPDERGKVKWVGINLTDSQKNNYIPSRFALREADEAQDDFEQHNNVVLWEGKVSDDFHGLPKVENATPETLLKHFAQCSPICFGRREHVDIAQYRQTFSPTGGDYWQPAEENNGDGLYRLDDKVYSPRAYLHKGETYRLGIDENKMAWAKIQHCIDNGIKIGNYDKHQKTISFISRLSLPFLIARVLFYNQMFVKGRVNGNTFYNIDDVILAQLQRILGNSIQEK